MGSNKGLYILLKENGRIHSEKITRCPCRSREKAMGYMWDGAMEVTLKEGAKVCFDFWHHCHDDDGSDSWVPSDKDLDHMWHPKFVPVGPEANSKLVDAYWYCFYVGEHIYVSKLGTFDGLLTKTEIIGKIKDGSWKEDSDLWCII